MTAKDVGRALLRDVEEVTLDEVLRKLQESTTDSPTSPPASSTPPTSIFGHRSLDSLLQPQPRQHSRLTSPSAPVIELTSAHPCSGKTELLYKALAHAVLPPSSPPDPTETTSSSKAGLAILIDCIGTFPPLQLSQTLHSQLASTQAPSDLTTLTSAVHHALSHIHVLRPQSLRALTSTIENLPTYLYNFSQHPSADRQLELLAIDGLTEFYWPQRAAADAARFDVPLGSQRGDEYLHLIRALRAFQTEFGCPIVATTQGLSTIPAKYGGRVGFRNLLPGSWMDFVTVKLACEREAVRRFPGGYGVREAEMDREKRREVLEKGRAVVWVVEGLKRGSAVNVAVGEDGVRVG